MNTQRHLASTKFAFNPAFLHSLQLDAGCDSHEVEVVEDEETGEFFAGGTEFWSSHLAKTQAVVPSAVVDAVAEVVSNESENMYRTYFQTGIEKVFGYFTNNSSVSRQAKLSRPLREIRAEANAELLRVLQVVEKDSDEYGELLAAAQKLESVIARAEAEENALIEKFWVGVIETIESALSGKNCGEKFFNNSVGFMRTSTGKAAIQLAAGGVVDVNAYIKKVLTGLDEFEFKNGQHQAAQKECKRASKRAAAAIFNESFAF